MAHMIKSYKDLSFAASNQHVDINLVKDKVTMEPFQHMVCLTSAIKADQLTCFACFEIVIEGRAPLELNVCVFMDLYAKEYQWIKRKYY